MEFLHKMVAAVLTKARDSRGGHYGQKKESGSFILPCCGGTADHLAAPLHVLVIFSLSQAGSISLLCKPAKKYIVYDPFDLTVPYGSTSVKEGCVQLMMPGEFLLYFTFFSLSSLVFISH